MARSPYLASFSVHILLMLVVLALAADRDASQATDTNPRTDANLIFVHTHAPSGGGSNDGGAEQPAPARRAQVRGNDAVSSPVAPPPSITPHPAPPDFELDAPIVSAVPAFADENIERGLPDPNLPRTGSPGPGRRDGLGDGDGTGLGPGRGPGNGDGIPGPGNGVSAPVPVRQVRPQYTSGAMSARLAGSVIVECIVMPDGTVGDARVTRSLDARLGLDEEALKAARQWRFRPGMSNGRPVAVRVTIELMFSIY
jgi:protein TonB